MEFVRLALKTLDLVMVPEYSRECRVVCIGDSLIKTLIIANHRSVLIVSTSSSQWCGQIHHLWYFPVMKCSYPAKQVESTQLVELVRIKPYNYALVIILGET